MTQSPLIEFALKTLSCTQKELANRLSVSQTQISKWKMGEHMSMEMETKLRELTELGDWSPEFILWTGSKEEATNWEALIYHLANRAKECEETGYDTWPLCDEMGHLTWDTLETLQSAGMDLPRTLPGDISSRISQINSEEPNEDDNEYFDELIQNNEYVSSIWKLFISLNSVWGFYSAYISDLIDDDALDLLNTDAVELEYQLLSIAACKANFRTNDESKFRQFKRKTMNDAEKSIATIKKAAFQSETPLRAELLELLTSSAEDLAEQAEAESLGLNKRRLHPDIYMNEMLCGMRLIHQVLPAILKKLDIEFEPDRSEFYIG